PVHGGDRYLVDGATRDLLQPLRSGLTLEFNYEDLQAESLSADAFAEKAGTLPFIDAARVLVLRDWGLLAGKRDKGAGAERAAAYLEGIPQTTQLVLIAHVPVAPGNPIYKAVAAMERDKRARILRYEPPRRSARAGARWPGCCNHSSMPGVSPPGCSTPWLATGDASCRRAPFGIVAGRWPTCRRDSRSIPLCWRRRFGRPLTTALPS